MTPPIMPLAHQQQCVDLLQRLVSVFGDAVHSVVHFEAKMTKNGPFPIELNLRMGGAESPTMVREGYKVSCVLNVKIEFWIVTTVSYWSLLLVCMYVCLFVCCQHNFNCRWLRPLSH